MPLEFDKPRHTPTRSLFVGEHCSVMINLDNIEFAMMPLTPIEGTTHDIPDPSRVEVFFKSGASIMLEHGNAKMFIKAWQRLAS